MPSEDLDQWAGRSALGAILYTMVKGQTLGWIITPIDNIDKGRMWPPSPL